MSAAPFRLLRTGTLGFSVLALAAASHIGAGGALPAPGIMIALIALNILVATVVSQFKVNLPAMLALLGLSQFVLHNAFELLAGGNALSVASTTSTGPAASAAMAHHLPADFTLVAGEGAHSMSGHGAMSLSMLAAHAVATIATALMLYCGENALWAVARWLSPIVSPRAVPMPHPVPRLRLAVWVESPINFVWRSLRADPQRGPPRLFGSFA